MTYQIFTIGCQMNQADSERLEAFLEAQGWKAGKNKPDIFVLNTCGVRQKAEDRIYGLVGRVKKKSPLTKIVIMGCLSYREDIKKKLKSQVNLFLPTAEMGKILEKLGYQTQGTCPENYLAIFPNYPSSWRAFVPIGNGCNNFCSYCVVPYARGREVWRSAQEILTEVKKLISQGYKEITLISQNVNSYRDGDYDFPKLLEKLASVPGDFWLRFFTSHPKDLSSKLIKVIGRYEKICPHLHLALQSGDNQILQAMNRRYTAEKFLSLVEKVRQARPGISISSDVIVAYPGESKAQFNNTLRVMKKAFFDQVFVARYSSRPGTASFLLADDVPATEKKRRELLANNVLRQTATANKKKYLGKELRVLVEKKVGQFYFGQTASAYNVKIKTGAEKLEPGNFCLVKIDKALDFGLEGSLVLPRPKAIAILGPTSAGKTAWGLALARKFKGEIVSADSRQVYKGLDIGSGKDLGEYGDLPYHLIDVVSPKKDFNLAQYQKLAQLAVASIIKKQKTPFLVGGSGLYLEALILGYNLAPQKVDQKLRAELESLSLLELQKRLKKAKASFYQGLNNSDRHNPRRLVRYLEITEKELEKREPLLGSPYEWLILGVEKDMESLKKKIKIRLKQRLEKENLIAEVESLLASGVSEKKLLSLGLEYRFVTLYLKGAMSYEEMFKALYQAICQFSKRQMTWFRRFEKKGNKIYWLKDIKKAEELCRDFLGL